MAKSTLNPIFCRYKDSLFYCNVLHLAVKGLKESSCYFQYINILISKVSEDGSDLLWWSVMCRLSSNLVDSRSCVILSSLPGAARSHLLCPESNNSIICFLSNTVITIFYIWYKLNIFLFFFYSQLFLSLYVYTVSFLLGWIIVILFFSAGFDFAMFPASNTKTQGWILCVAIWEK